MSRNKIFAALGAGVAFLISVGGYYANLQEETVDAALAQAYLTDYYAETTKDPSVCCYDQTDELFRKNKAGSKERYVTFFRQFKAVEVSNVDEVSDGVFDVTLTHVYDSGRRSKPATVRFTLRCLDRTKLPLMKCDTDDVRIRHTDQLVKTQ